MRSSVRKKLNERIIFRLVCIYRQAGDEGKKGEGKLKWSIFLEIVNIDTYHINMYISLAVLKKLSICKMR